MGRLKWMVRITAFSMILLLCTVFASDVLRRKDSDFKYKPFFEQKEDFDVLFMGTSHVIQGVFPMDLWDEYGIVSYNFGGNSNRIATSYWVMKNAFEYTSPKLVVIDAFLCGEMQKFFYYSELVHMSAGAFPLTMTKIRGICDLIDTPGLLDSEGKDMFAYRWEYLWNLGKYHPRWKELNENDIMNKSVTKEKGAEARVNVAKPDPYEPLPKTETLPGDTVGLEYLRKMIEDCQRSGVEVLLTYLPFPAAENYSREANSVYAIAEEYGVNYINFLELDGVVDFNTDLFDSDHLNASGAKKITDYIGRYIKGHYDIPDRRTDTQYQSWFGDYEDYISFKTDKLNQQDSLQNELMLLADKGYSLCMYVKDGSPALKDDTIYNLINNMALQRELPELDVAADGSAYLLVIDNSSGLCWECMEGMEGQAGTSFGNVAYDVGGESPCLFIGDSADNLLAGEWSSPDSGTDEPDVQLFVVENQTKSVVSVSRWYFVGQTFEKR